jgi:hypothetical protein
MAEIPSALLPNEALPASEEMPQALGDTPIVAPSGKIDGNLMSLYDHKNNTVLAVEPTEAEVYLKTGQYTLPKGSRVNVVDENGDAASVDSSEVYNALQSGYRMEQPQETEQRRTQEQYGDLGGQIAAAGAGAARGLTFGLSDQALVGAGVAPETLRGLEEANPISSLVGEATGIVAPAVLSGGISSVAGAGVKGAAAAGKATERLIAKQAIKAGLSNPIAKSIATKIAPAAVGSAVEGAFYGAGQLLSEDALGKADLNAENLAAYVGTGALLNGAFGAAFSGAAELAKPVGQAAKFISSPFTSKISQNLDSQISTGRILGLTPVQMQKLQARNPKIAESMKQYLTEDLKLGLMDTAEDLATKNRAIKEAAGAEIGSVLDEADQVLKTLAPEARPTNQQVWDNVYQKVFKTVEDVFGTDVPGGDKMRKAAEGFLDDIAALGKKEGSFNASELQGVKKALDKMLKYEKDPGKWTQLEDMAYSARSAIRDEIDGLAKKLEDSGNAGNLSERLRSANRQYSSSATFGDFLEKRAMRAGDRDFSLTNALRDSGLDLQRKLVVLGKIEQGRQAVSRAVKSTVKAFGEGTKGTSLALQTTVPSIVNSALAQDYSKGKSEKPRTKEQAYNNVLNNINSFTASPTSFMEKANRQTASIYKAAPQTSAQLDNLAMTAMTYLSSKAPKRNENVNLLTPFRPVSLPSTQELAKFARILHAVEKPMDVLKNLERGTASREEMEVLKDVYPSTFTELQETFMAELPKLQKTIPYNRRVQMGLLLGMPADASMLPQNILGLQGLFQVTPEQGGGAVNPTVGGMKELASTAEMLTPLQQAQAGLGDD